MASLSMLLSRKREKKKELDIYRQRKSKLKKVERNINNSFDDNVSEAINHNERSGSELIMGIQGDISNIKTLSFEIDELKERYIWNDSNLSDALSNVSREISRCETEIMRLEDEIDSLNRQIESARETETED